MKFGRKMREQCEDVFDATVLEHTLDYKRLKKLISKMKAEQESGGDVQEHLRDWESAFAAECRKFDEFHRQLVDESTVRVTRVEQALSTEDQMVGSGRQAVWEETRELYCHLNEILLFAELNRTGCRKILKKIEKRMSSGTQARCSQTLPSLCVCTMDDTIRQLMQRVVCVYAALFSQGSCQVAQMELDYHVTCISDIYQHIQEHSGVAAFGSSPQSAEVAMTAGLQTTGQPHEIRHSSDDDSSEPPELEP
eukprot:Hpha_TRINITY_DN12279_c0_g1::TRINITY_DN12279_c0_g1_i1::g.16628::m.16628